MRQMRMQMRMRREILLIFSLALAHFSTFAHVAHAQKNLTWAQAVTETSESNPELRAGHYNLRSAEFQQKQARSGYYPQIFAGALANRGNKGGSSAGVGSFSDSVDSSGNSSANSGGPTNDYSQSLSLTQNLFSGFDTTERVRQAAANTDTSRASLELTKAKVSFDLKSAFSALVYSQNYLTLAVSIMNRREENLRIVDLRYQSGSENKGSFLLSGASLAQAKFDRLQAANAIEVSRQQLAKVLGRDDATLLNVRGNVPVAEPEKALDFLKLAKNTPEDRQALAQREAARAATEIARAQFYPNINATTDLVQRQQSDGSDRDSWQVGLGLTIPLFTGGKDYYAVKAATQTALAADSNRVNIYTQEIFKLKQDYTRFVEAIERLRVDLSFVEAASVRAEIARSKYNNGLISFEDWDIIENDLIARQKTALLSERDRIIAQATWEQTQGTGVIK